jgi:hypothetical protein
MPRRPRVIVKTEFYYSTDSECDSESESDSDDSDYESESDATTVIFNDDDWRLEESGSEVSDSEDGTDYESETDVESDSEELDDPKPYFGKGFRVYFDSHADKKFFMTAFGFRSS